MIGLLIGALAAPGAVTSRIPDTAPLYCLDDKQVEQPIQRTSYARLTASYRQHLGLATRRLTQSSTRSGLLTFSGGENGTENVSYDVEPVRGPMGLGILLTGMHVRLGGLSDDLVGDAMCEQTFSIVNGQ